MTNPISAVRTTSTQIPLFTDCWDLQSRGGVTDSGVYEIHPIQGSNASLNGRCDMLTDGGGWTVLQRRLDGSVNFTRSMTEYVEGIGVGFKGSASSRVVSAEDYLTKEPGSRRCEDYLAVVGDIGNLLHSSLPLSTQVLEIWHGEHWIGLDAIHFLTSHGGAQLRVDLCGFSSQAGYDGQSGYALHRGFTVSDQNDTFRLHTGVYVNGSNRDRLRASHGHVFRVTRVCTDFYRGGWWYGRSTCYSANLNGGRYNGGQFQGIVWDDFGGSGWSPSLRSSKMKIRPLTAPGDLTHAYSCHP